MPIYEYACSNTECAIVFEEIVPLSERDVVRNCPECDCSSDRMISNFAFQYGRTRADKKIGATNDRVDKTKYMLDAREKRKKKYAPGSREAESNELWVGTEVQDGVIKAPNHKKKIKVVQ